MFSISTMLALSHISAALRSRTVGAPSRRMVVKGLLAAIAAGVPADISFDPVSARRHRRHRGDRTRAADDVHKRPDYGSKLAFKLECELLGGTFSEDGVGNTFCHTPYGGVIECDANGNDCWYDPGDEDSNSGGLPHPPFGPGNQVPDGPALPVEDPTSDGPWLDVVAVDQHRNQDQRKRKRKGKKGRQRQRNK